MNAASKLAAVNGEPLSMLPILRFALDEVAAAHEAVVSAITGKLIIDLS